MVDFMRYEKFEADFVDRDFLQFTSGEHEGDIVLCATDELIDITNKIRLEQGNTDLVGLDYDNEVYYNFYLMFDTRKKNISIQAVSNYGEKDDEVYYELPMTEEEKVNVMFQLIEILAKELYKNQQIKQWFNLENERRVIKVCQRKTKEMREFEPILKANGYREIRSNGSHFIYSNGTNQITVNKDLNKMVRKRLIKENNLVER